MDSPRPVRRVFISSSHLDLEAHRLAVHDTLERMELLPVDMAQFGARIGNATDESVALMDDCDLCIVIVAWRYGTIPANDTRSITEIECDEAVQKHIPRLIFLSDPQTEQQDGPNDLFPAATRNPNHHRQLLNFRDSLKAQVVDYFTTPDNLGRKVATALYSYMRKIQILALPPEQRLPHEVPSHMPGFVGREQALADLCAALRHQQSVGVVAAVVGMGGVGKSTLAAEAVYQVTAEPGAFPGGMALVRCDRLVGAEGQRLIYDEILTKWHHPLSPEELATATTPETMLAQREQALRSRLALPGAALVLLDNVEKDLPLTPILELFAAINITTLVTTRVTPTSPRLQIHRLSVLSPDAAVALFAEQYALRGGTWEPQADHAATLEVVKTLGYLPLAINVVAARAARLQQHVARLAQELRQSGLLTRLNNPAESNASVRYVLSKSLELLTLQQRSCFAALGLPDGPDWPYPVIITMLDALAEISIAATGETDLDLLVALSLVSLVEPENELSTDVSTPMRVRLHPLLRELAQEEWRQQPEATQNAAITGLLQGVAYLAYENKHDFTLLQQEEALIVGAMRLAAQRAIASQGVIDAVEALFDYLTTGGYWQLGMQLFQLQLAASCEVGDKSGEGTTLNSLGVLADDLGRKEEAAQYFEQALVIHREVGNRAMEGTTLNNLGELARSLGRTEEAARYYEQALVMHREVGNRAMEGTTLNNLGALSYDLGRKKAAEQYCEQALVIHREVGNREGKGTTLNNLGELARSLGRTEEAAQYYEQALVILEEIGAVDSVRVVRENLESLRREMTQAVTTIPVLPANGRSTKKQRWWQRR